MALTATQAQAVEKFRTWMDGELARAGGFGAPQRADRPDGSTLTTRYPLERKLFLEVTVRPLLPQVRVGIVTDDRWRSEELEEGIETSGDNMSEYLEVAFSEAGLDWENPPVEHYRHEGIWYSYVTPVDLKSPDDLGGEALRAKLMKMIQGYMHSYGKF